MDQHEAEELAAWVAEVASSYHEKEEKIEFDKSVYQPFKNSTQSKVEKQSSVFATNEKKYEPKHNKVEVLEIRDLNTATAEALQIVKGIGPSFSERIVKFRSKLGGFASNDQLQEVYGLSDETISEIKKHFDVQSLPRPIDINSDSAKVLANHPYINYDLAWIIINYRRQNGDIQSADDLRKIQALDDETFARLKPYLD